MGGNVACRIFIVTGERSTSVVARESGFLEKIQGEGFGKSLSARARVGMESN